VPHTAFQAAVRSRAALDLMRTPFVRERVAWTHRSDYYGTQAFAALARTAHIELIRYESVRDPEHAACAAVLDPVAFGRGKPHGLETWFIAAARSRVRCAMQGSDVPQLEFAAAQLLGEQ